MRMCLLVGTVSLLVINGLPVDAGPEKPIPPFDISVNAKSGWSTVVKFKKGYRANIIVIGDGKSYLALYVFDPQGNCVARDDDLSGKFLDDRWVIWYPRRSQEYTIQIRNLGDVPDKCKVVIR